MTIHFSGTLTKQQFNHFQQLCMPTFLKWFLKWFHWIWLGLILIKVLSITSYIRSSMLVFDILVFLYLLLFAPKLRERQIRRAWEGNKIIQGEVSGLADQEGIVWSHVYGELRCPWEIIYKYREEPDIVLLYTGISQAIILPRSFFHSEEDWKQFRRLVSEKLP